MHLRNYIRADSMVMMIMTRCTLPKNKSSAENDQCGMIMMKTRRWFCVVMSWERWPRVYWFAGVQNPLTWLEHKAVSIVLQKSIVFERSGVSITRVKLGCPGLIPGYPANMCRDIPSYPILYRVILRRDIPGYPKISQDKIPVLGYPITSFLYWVIPGYPGIYTKSGYPGISRDIPCGRFSRWCVTVYIWHD